MALKGVAMVSSINSGQNDQTQVSVTLYIVGLVSGNAVTRQTVVIPDIDPTILNVTWEAALKQFTKDYLVNNHGYSFGLLDTVRLLGETLI